MSGAASAAPVLDGGFEVEGAAMGNDVACLFGSTCPLGAWSGSSGTGSTGINRENSGVFEGNTPDGSYYAFIQSLNGSTSYIYQDVTLSAGTYDISWLAGGRTNFSGPPSYSVSFGGNQIFSDTLLAAQPFTETSARVSVGAGTYRLMFTSHTSAGDNSVLIDHVDIAAASVPEAATWAMMLGGFGMMGMVMRRKNKVRLSAA